MAHYCAGRETEGRDEKYQGTTEREQCGSREIKGRFGKRKEERSKFIRSRARGWHHSIPQVPSQGHAIRVAKGFADVYTLLILDMGETSVSHRGNQSDEEGRSIGERM